jgi:hypothetical protein
MQVHMKNDIHQQATVIFYAVLCGGDLIPRMNSLAFGLLSLTD